ncbi:hypothetical protein KI387_003724, partial [Taxus chinensis]
MDPKTKLEIEKTVLEILENADMNDMTEFKVRKLAGERLGQDLSDAKYKKFVRNIVESFLRSRDDEEEEQPAEKEEQVQEEVEEEEEKASKDQEKKEKYVGSEEEEEDKAEEEEEERPAKKQRKQIAKQRGPVQTTSKDENDDLVICNLSNRRSVTIQNFRGQNLVSIREYYEKNGKRMPSSK